MRLSPLSWVRRSIRSRRSPVRYECRRCGTPLDGDDDVCPECGAGDVAQFVV